MLYHYRKKINHLCLISSFVFLKNKFSKSIKFIKFMKNNNEKISQAIKEA